jgi:hypothetical protein
VSEPKRYRISGLHPHIYEDKEGFMVYYEDYARLKAEVERLTDEHGKAVADFWNIHAGYFRLEAEVNRLTDFTTRTIIPNEELQAQVERMTKAGDAMMDWIDQQHDDSGYPHAEAWHAAKEGKQP